MSNKEASPRTSVPMWTQPYRSKALALLSVGVAFLGVYLAPGRVEAAEYYVASTGSDSNPGSLAQPFATLQKGNDVAAAGDTVWLRGGTYQIARQVRLSKSGQSDTRRTKYWAYQKEVPILDFSGYISTDTGADVPTILVTGDWLHVKGLEIANGVVGQIGAHSNSALRSEGASNNIFELLNIHHNFGPGLFISKGTGGNLVLNCDSHDNYDKNGSQGDGQNADGFGVHYQTSGPSTVLRGNRAWINSDDGYDLISQEVPVTIENCWAVTNGYSNGGSGMPTSGNGNGFKAGSSQTGIRHILQNNVAWKNRAAGFYSNHSSGGNTWFNNTSYMNSVQYNMLASSPGDSASTIILTGALVHRMRNNVGFPNRNSNMGGVESMFNTWDLGLTEASNDFVSTVDTGYTGPRQADGSLPALDFLKLRAGSPLIDKGTNVGLPFVGTASDLGAYEYGLAVIAGTGGTGNPPGSGGSTGSGGSAGGGGGVGSLGGAMAGTTGTAGARIGNGTGTGAVGATGATGGFTAGATNGATGCACALGSSAGRGETTCFLLMVGALVLRARRRRNRS